MKSASRGQQVGFVVMSKKSAQKLRKCDLVLGDCLCGQQHGLAMNWVDQPRSSADEQMLSGRHAVVII